MLERVLENDASFIQMLTDNDCVYLKFSILGMAGFPDRIILGKNRLIFFVEWKRPGATNGKRKGEKLQHIRHQQLRSFGFNVYVLDSVEKAKETLLYELGQRNKPS